ncbi:MAG: GntR family transcriptional regulator [Acidimicrobiales bacterium]
MNRAEDGSRGAPARSHLYQQLVNELRDRIARGEFQSGMLLPSEGMLSKAHNVSRPTVKRALDILRQEGIIDAKRGFGWFVAGTLLREKIGQLHTIEDSVLEMGLVSRRKILEFAFEPATPEVKAVLGSDMVLRTKRVNLANEKPVACVTTWCPDDLGSSLSRADVEEHSLYDLLPIEIGGARQVIRAVAASKEDAQLLDLRVGSPCLASERITYSVDGRPVLTAVAIFPGHSSEYVAELTGSGRSETNPGVRLVDDGAMSSNAITLLHGTRGSEVAIP